MASWLGVALMCLFAAAAGAASLEEGWVSFDGVTMSPQPARVEVLSSSLSEVVLRLTVPGMVVERSVEDGDTYDRLSLPGYEHSGDTGFPAMPAVRHLVAVPRGCEVSVSAVALDSLSFSNALVYPVEEIVTRYTGDGWPYLVEEFAKDSGAYSRTNCFPAAVVVAGDVGSFRGQGVVPVEVSPIRFTPSSGELVVTPTMLVTLTITGGSGTTAEDIGPFTDIASELLLGYDGSGAVGWRGPGDAGSWGVKRSIAGCDSIGADYLMIVEGSLMGSRALRDLATHRTTYNGWNVAIVPDTTVANTTGGGSISPTAIRDFIQDVYELEAAEHLSDGHLGYVLLVGDAREDVFDSLIPADELSYGSSDSTLTTDHMYACVDGDGYFPDLSLGRMCVSDTLELFREANRVIDYEVDAAFTEAWRSKALLACGFAWHNCNAADEDQAAGVDATFNLLSSSLSQAGINSQEVHAHEQWPASGCVDQYNAVQGLIEGAVNGGTRFVEICTHGAIHEYYGFQDSRVGVLANGDSLALWLSYSCMTGAYDRYNAAGQNWDCIGEALMHENPSGGAVAFFGASENSISAWDDIGVNLWEAMLDHDHHAVGDAIVAAKIKYLALRDIETLMMSNYHFGIFNLLGDPALNVFLADAGSAGYASAPDYAVDEDDISTDPPFGNVETQVDLQAEIHNESNYIPDGPVDVVFEVTEVGGGTPAFAGTTQVAPGPWDSATAVVTWSPGAVLLGRMELCVTVTPTTGPAELLTTNNAACRPISTYVERDGFPIDLGGAPGIAPLAVDATSDMGLEVISGSALPGNILLVTCDGDTVWSDPSVPASQVHGPVAVGDINMSGTREAVVLRGSAIQIVDLESASPVYEYGGLTGLCGAATLGDIVPGGEPGDLEIVVERVWSRPVSGHATAVVDAPGDSLVWESPTGGPVGTLPVISSPVIADLNADGRPDIVSASGRYSGMRVEAISATGDELWSVSSGGLVPEFPCATVAADVVADSVGVELLCGADDLMCISSRGGDCWQVELEGSAAGLAVLDLTGDGWPEVVAGTHLNYTSLNNCDGFLYVVDGSGTVLDSIALGGACLAAPVLADLDGDEDEDVEIVVTASHDEGFISLRRSFTELHVFTFDGQIARHTDFPRPLLFWGRCTASPLIADTDLDGSPEIWLADGEGLLHCLDLKQLNMSGTPSRWSSFQHDERHTGTYETPLSGAYPTGSSVSWWGDYLMTGDVTVDLASSMLIQPGTTVYVEDDDDQAWGADTTEVELIVQGEIRAVGDTAIAPIHFVPRPGSQPAADWYGIRLLPYSSGEFGGCIVKDGFIGVSAQRPDEFRVEDCRIETCLATGVQCTDQVGTADVLIRGNHISRAETGVYLANCNATVDSNTIADCGSYGINATSDYESDITDNVISFPDTGTSFAGIRVAGTLTKKGTDLNIVGNTITNAASSGIICTDQDFRSVVSIRDNAIIDEHTPAVAKGMYFDNSLAVPRLNRIEGVQDGFWVEVAHAGCYVPNLGITMGDGGYNCVDGASLRFGVRAGPYSATTVRAEGNWWNTAYADSSLFLGPVDWVPCLADSSPCTSVGRGLGELPEDSEAHVPFCLVQNAPNPFNPTTSLRFGLPAEQHVTLAVYNLAGRCIRELVDGRLAPGWHDVTWDGRDDHHRQVASGVYFCRLESQGSASVKKLVLLK